MSAGTTTDPAVAAWLLSDRERGNPATWSCELLAEHLDRAPDDVEDLLDPERAAEAVRCSAEALDSWYRDGQVGPRPPGRLRPHRTHEPPRWQRGVAALSYRLLFDPDGRPPLLKLQRRM